MAAGYGVPDPEVNLFIALPSDSRPGVSYSSLAPGRVVAVCARAAVCEHLGNR
jgi:hypothetical protein